MHNEQQAVNPCLCSARNFLPAQHLVVVGAFLIGQPCAFPEHQNNTACPFLSSFSFCIPFPFHPHLHNPVSGLWSIAVIPHISYLHRTLHRTSAVLT